MSEDSFLISFVGSGSWSSSLAETPVSTHTSIWPFSHSEVQSGGNKSFFFLFVRSSQHKPVHCRALGQFSKTFLGVGGIHSSNPTPYTHLSQRASCWSTTEFKRGLKTEQSRVGFGCTSSTLDVRNVKVSQGNSSSSRKTGKETKRILTHFGQWE